MRAKRDGNEKEIVAALRQLGASVIYLNMPDAPDLLVGIAGECNVLIETKTPTGKLRPGQVAFAENWQGTPVVVIRSIDEAIGLINNANLRLPLRKLQKEKRSMAVHQRLPAVYLRGMWWEAGAPDYFGACY